jgi:hypothetical protein
MKSKIVIVLSFLMMHVFIAGCKKEAGTGGKNTISGTVSYKNGVTGNNDAAPMATISIAYGTSEATSTFNQTILTDADGKYSIEGLQKGKYFIKAGYTDAHGFNYTTPGHGVTLENKKNNIEVNITTE